MQCKDIPDEPILIFLRDLGRWGTWYPGFDNSVQNSMPEGTPGKLVVAKMRRLIQRGLVDGCPCGCRGDYEPTPKGLALITPNSPPQTKYPTPQTAC